MARRWIEYEACSIVPVSFAYPNEQVRVISLPLRLCLEELVAFLTACVWGWGKGGVGLLDGWKAVD
jgi:hypothetical protein